MRALNKARYGTENSVRTPDLPQAKRSFGKGALAFIRDCCEDLKFDNSTQERKTLSDSDRRSAGKKQIPYNMERDLDRLCFETAIGRFLNSGSKEEAFDIYYCYCLMMTILGQRRSTRKGYSRDSALGVKLPAPQMRLPYASIQRIMDRGQVVSGWQTVSPPLTTSPEYVMIRPCSRVFIPQTNLNTIFGGWVYQFITKLLSTPLRMTVMLCSHNFQQRQI